jgi:hypothetical protein
MNLDFRAAALRGPKTQCPDKGRVRQSTQLRLDAGVIKRGYTTIAAQDYEHPSEVHDTVRCQ